MIRVFANIEKSHPKVVIFFNTTFIIFIITMMIYFYIKKQGPKTSKSGNFFKIISKNISYYSGAN